MTQTLTVNTARPNLAISLVAGLSQPYTPKAFTRLVFGETIDVNLYLIDGGAYDARSGVAGYTPRISITLDNETPQSGTFTISDGTATTTALDWDASTVEIEDALNALNTDTGPFGDTVTVDKFGNGAFSILFDTVGAQAVLTIDAGGIQPLSAASVLPIVEGSATAREEQIIKIAAEPLVFADGGTTITNGWRMTLDANNANFLRAVAAEQGDLSANFSIEVVNVADDVDVVAKGPVILSPATFNVSALNGIEYPNTGTLPDSDTQIVTATTYTAQLTDGAIMASNAAGVLISLPDGSTVPDRYRLTINNVGASGAVTIDGFGSDTILNQPTITLNSQDESVTIGISGTNWFIS